MFGFARGEVFSINNKKLSKDINSKRSWFSNEPENTTWLNVSEVIIISNDIVNKFSSVVSVLPIVKSLVGYSVTSIDDIEIIKRTYLEEKVGAVSGSTLEKLNDNFRSENHKAIPIKCQEK